MALTWSVGLVILGIVAVVIAQAMVKRTSTRKNVTWAGAVVAVIAILALANVVPQLGGLNSPINLGGATLAVEGTPSTGANGANVNVQPTASYSTLDKFVGTAIGGTAYYKANGNPASTTALSSVNPGVQYTYWVSNTSYYVAPKTFVGDTLSNIVVNTEAYKNGSASVIIYDSLNNVNIQDGNLTAVAGATQNFQVKYQGTYQQSAMPFGGVLVVEANSSIAQITCSGDDISNSVPYNKVTYTVASTGNSYQTFGVAPSIDDGSSNVRTINCQIKQPSSATTGTVKLTFIPANWYKANDGSFQLDVQKTANQDTTRTGLGTVVSSFTLI